MHVNKEKIYPYNSNREKQVILLMISNGEGCKVKSKGRWHYLAVKKLSIIRGITSKNNGDVYCLNCLHFVRTKNKLESHKKVCANKDLGNVNMPSEDTKILEFNQYQKFDKAPFIIYADLECKLENINGLYLENSSTTKVCKHIPSGFSMSTISSFKIIGNKHDVYRGKNCMEMFCESLREHAMKIINLKKYIWSY